MDISAATLEEISLHYIGNKLLDKHLIRSNKPLRIDEELAELITQSFFQRLTTAFEEYNFTHNASLDFNEVYNYVKDIFEEEDVFHENSIKIAEHLYEQSTHPNIKEGELYVCLFSDYYFKGAYVDAVGIFKTETKKDYLEVLNTENKLDIELKSGIDLTKIEKGCFIVNAEKEKGYNVRIFDNQNRGADAQYWKNDFLGLAPVVNEYKQTNEFLNITKEFISKQIDEEFEISKTDKIDLLNKSVDYFKTKDTFTKEEFEEEVFQDTDLITSFRGFDSSYRETHELEEQEDSFEISSHAVKKQAKSFKSVLKLDKNFHIYIHGDRSKIQKGTDPDGRKYYKVYFDQEK